MFLSLSGHIGRCNKHYVYQEVVNRGINMVCFGHLERFLVRVWYRKISMKIKILNHKIIFFHLPTALGYAAVVTSFSVEEDCSSSSTLSVVELSAS